MACTHDNLHPYFCVPKASAFDSTISMPCLRRTVAASRKGRSSKLQQKLQIPVKTTPDERNAKAGYGMKNPKNS